MHAICLVFLFAMAGLSQTALPAAPAAAGPGSLGRPCAECFAVEALPLELRLAAEGLFLRVMDSEGLYAVSGLRPMSSGFLSAWLEAEAPSLQAVNMQRKLLEWFDCNQQVFATVHHFHRTYPDPETGRLKRAYEGVVFSRPALRAAVKRHEAFFAALGASADSHPMEVLLAVEYAPEPVRWRGLGILYGFPDHAIDFFVRAGEQERRGGSFVERSFISLPTFSRPERGVVYAVPKDHVRNEADRQLESRFRDALRRYQERRAQFLGEGKPGIIALLRDWFRQEDGLCRQPLGMAEPAGAATSHRGHRGRLAFVPRVLPLN